MPSPAEFIYTLHDWPIAWVKANIGGWPNTAVMRINVPLESKDGSVELPMFGPKVGGSMVTILLVNQWRWGFP